MKRVLRKIKITALSFGLDISKMLRACRGLPFYFSTFFELKQQKKGNSDFRTTNFYPILHERFEEAGTMSGHYFHQDLYVARKIFEAQPKRHIDIGSRIDGFVAHIAVFRVVEVIDIRDQKNEVKNILFKQADLMRLPNDLIESCDSLSSLHAIEHFGLGRYGDPIDYHGHIKVLHNIHKILKKDGTFYFSVPIGEQRIEFNAHRVFSVQYLLNILDSLFAVESFSYVNDEGNFYENVGLNKEQINNNYGCHYGCGIFILRKK